MPPIESPCNRLHNDDCVIDHQSDGHCHATERHKIESLVRQPHGKEGYGEGHGHGARCDGPGTQVSQEQRDDPGAQHNAEQDGVTNARHRLSNKVRLVIDRIDGHAWGQRRQQCQDGSFRVGNDLGSARPGHAGTAQAHGLAFGTSDSNGAVFGGLLDLGDISEGNRHARGRQGHGHVADFV